MFFKGDKRKIWHRKLKRKRTEKGVSGQYQ